MSNGTTNVYCDESGYTGNNLLDEQQPYFVYAAVVIEPETAEAFIAEAIKEFGVQGGELKGSKLLKYHKGRRAIEKVLRTFARTSKLSVHHKKFALSTYFFEYIFEPALATQNSVFYKANFHRFIAGIVYAHWIGQHRTASDLVTRFSSMMKTLDITQLSVSNARSTVVSAGSELMDDIALFALLNQASIEEELSVLHGDGKTPNWILDLTTTSLFQILSELAHEHKALAVFCDASKPLIANRAVFEAMVDRPDMPTTHFWDGRAFGFNLTRPPEFVDSKSCPGIQIADVIAAAASYVAQNRHEEVAQSWLPLLRPAFFNSHITPDLKYAQPSSVWGFVGAVILKELVRRSLLQEDLLEGMTELIARAEAQFPSWVAARGLTQP